MKQCYLVFILCFLLTGCYRECPCPSWEMPENFVEDRQDEECPAEVADLGFWWKQFNDQILDQLVEKSFRCNFDVRIARERIMEARALHQVEFAKLFPEIDLDAYASRTRTSQTIANAQFFGPTYQTIYQVAFDSTWELDFFGKNYYSKQAAYYDIRKEIENVRQANVTALGDIAKNYIDIRGLQERLDLTQKTIETEEKLYELALTRYEAGLVTRVDVFEAKALVESAKANLPLLDQEMKQHIYALSVLVGMMPRELFELLCPHQCIPCAKGKIPMGLPSDLLKRRGDIKKAEMNWRAAGFRVASAKAEIFPSVTLDTSYGYQTTPLNMLFKPASVAWTLMPSLSWPVFDAGRICGNIKTMSSRARQALFEYEKTIMTALSEVETALANYYQEYERELKLEQEVHNYRSASELLTERYKGGLVSFTDVLQVERSAYNSELLLIESKQQMMVNLIAIYKALGGGWECCDMP